MSLERAQGEPEALLHARAGLDDIVRINVLDGVRIYFKNGDVVHIRRSGNAP